ncbi:MAG: hypothetical protein JO112_23240, partial [Planctomycetes bacterium]|nr:hypothetical protein [Planctomycetota bacterium]
LGMNLPWSAFALLTLWPGFARRWDERGRRLLQALHCWTWPNLLFWSLIPSHSIRHSLPLCPGLAGLAGMVWANWVAGEEGRRQKAEGKRQKKPVVSSLPSAFCFLPSAFSSRRPPRILIGLLVLWLAVKLVFVEVVVPRRLQGRDARLKGELLAALVPEGNTLYLFRLKDEGIMFYYHRTVCRLPSPDQLPSSGEPLYCMLDRSEWSRWGTRADVESVRRLEDEQGDPMVLVKVHPQQFGSGKPPS